MKSLRLVPNTNAVFYLIISSTELGKKLNARLNGLLSYTVTALWMMTFTKNIGKRNSVGNNHQKENSNLVLPVGPGSPGYAGAEGLICHP